MADERFDQESRITIERPARSLEAVIARPDLDPPRGGAVVCHPHPQFGGTMDNAVVVSVCRALVASGFITLRFNFGGVGRSQGTHSGGPEEIADALAATEALTAQLSSGTPCILVGYSYGAWVALQVGSNAPRIGRIVAIAPPLNLVDWDSLGIMSRPVSVIAAERDQFCNPNDLARFVRERGDVVTLHAIIAGADHFFWGFEEQAASACCSASTEPLPG